MNNNSSAIVMLGLESMTRRYDWTTACIDSG